ncbi:MAG TPA: flagellar protein FlaG [Salinarimonas sp.]|jgi:hypothetical protein|nr:flagellar protein FlaG [Salinarimonas sp.]
METGSTKPVAPTTATPTPRGDSATSFKAVHTDLPAQASVQQVERVEAVRFEPSDGLEERAAVEAAIRAILRRSTTIDEETGAVVTRAVDQESGEVVSQTPDAALLRLRAYLHEMQAARPDAEPALLNKRA